MKKITRIICLTLLLSTAGAVLSSFYTTKPGTASFGFPYKQAGFTEQQAAAHLLNRFTFGATPRQVDEVVNTGLEKWFSQQLNANLKDDSLQDMLKNYETLQMSNAEIVKTFPKGGQVFKMAVKEGVVDRDSAQTDKLKKEYKKELKNYMEKKDYRRQSELFQELINQKILRAAYSNNQLKEILTDFWFNHFNVSLTNKGIQHFITSYERDAIRPNALTNFETLLMATAKSPAMLNFLDNVKSSAPDSAMAMNSASKRMAKKYGAQNDMNAMPKTNANGKIKKPKTAGLNENYAREIMELHTLGVDGGYTQSDVTQAARVLTGWTVYPFEYGKKPGKGVNEKMGEDRLKKLGYVHEGDFLFAANRHDQGEKKVLGAAFTAGGGYEEGVRLIKMLAHHPSTAKFISRKIAVRFVSDNPPQSLVDKMAKTFLEKDGDIKQVLITMTSSPEFWSKESLREKTKSPFELAISSVRSLNAVVYQPIQLNNWITKMGQKVYFYQAPTGYPDRGQYWINTGSLLSRMNFGLALASQRIPGIKVNLLALNKGHEPESAQNALVTYSKLIMPERDLEETVKRLTPLLNDPDLDKKVDEAAGKTAPPQQAGMETNQDAMMSADITEKKVKDKVSIKDGKKGLDRNSYASMQSAVGTNNMLSQVIGIIIGSPEFQRK